MTTTRIRYCEILKKDCDTAVCPWSKDELCDYPYMGKRKHPVESFREPIISHSKKELI